jgi:hypothetical protein
MWTYGESGVASALLAIVEQRTSATFRVKRRSADLRGHPDPAPKPTPAPTSGNFIDVR